VSRCPLDRRPDSELLDLTGTCPEAFGVFYRRHAPAITAYLAIRTDDVETALDLTAEVFEAALVGRRGFQPAKGPARAWLYGIARHKMARNFRERSIDRATRIRLRVPALQYTDDALEEVERTLDASRGGLLRDVDLLPVAEREAVLARVVGERSYGDIARGAGVEEAAVRKRVSRGLARLRTRIMVRARRERGMRG
jgi:RNA polymerase sigma-70 factor (ECF subfamily)